MEILREAACVLHGPGLEEWTETIVWSSISGLQH